MLKGTVLPLNLLISTGLWRVFSRHVEKSTTSRFAEIQWQMHSRGRALLSFVEKAQETKPCNSMEVTLEEVRLSLRVCLQNSVNSALGWVLMYSLLGAWHKIEESGKLLFMLLTFSAYVSCVNNIIQCIFFTLAVAKAYPLLDMTLHLLKMIWRMLWLTISPHVARLPTFSFSTG